MGDIFLYGRTVEKELVTSFSKLTVYCQSGTAVRATMAGTSYVLETPIDSDGKAVFDYIGEGYWDITICDIENAPVKRIKIDSLDYTISLDNFEAYINVTYPYGYTCIVTDYADIYYFSPDTSGTWECTVPKTGTWYVSYIDDVGFYDYAVVNISNDGQRENVELAIFEAHINVTYPSGYTCIVTDYVDTSYTAPDTSGTWKCTIPRPGTWYVACIDSFEYYDYKVVDISHNGQSVSTTIDRFNAYINVTYPAGSTCTCSNGITKLFAPNTSGSHTFTIPNIGTWTIECTDGTTTRTRSIKIDENNQNESVEIIYKLYLYNNGDQCFDVTGGWAASTYDGDGTKFFIQDATMFTSYQPNLAGYGLAATVNQVRIDGYTSFNFSFNVTDISTASQASVVFYVALLNDTYEPIHGQQIEVSKTGIIETSIDTSVAVTGSYYVAFAVSGIDLTILEVYYE